MSDDLDEQIIKLYKEGSSKAAISYLLDVSSRRVALVLACAGIPTRNTRISQQEKYDRMRRLLSVGVSQKEVARRVGMNRTSVRYAQSQGFRVKPLRTCKSLGPTIVDLFKGGLSYDRIAKQLKICSTTVRKYVKIEREMKNGTSCSAD